MLVYPLRTPPGLAVGLPDGIFSINDYGIFLAFGPFQGHLIYFMVIGYIFPRFGMMYQKNLAPPAGSFQSRTKKSGNPGLVVFKAVPKNRATPGW
jgi:hypothetical protein